jgi:hypothetical protein
LFAIPVNIPDITQFRARAGVSSAAASSRSTDRSSLPMRRTCCVSSIPPLCGRVGEQMLRLWLDFKDGA